MQEREVTFSPGKKSLTTVKHLKNTYNIKTTWKKLWWKNRILGSFQQDRKRTSTHDSNTTAYAEISMPLQKKLSL